MNGTICAAGAYLQEQGLTGVGGVAEYRCNLFSKFTLRSEDKGTELSADSHEHGYFYLWLGCKTWKHTGEKTKSFHRGNPACREGGGNIEPDGLGKKIKVNILGRWKSQHRKVSFKLQLSQTRWKFHWIICKAENCYYGKLKIIKDSKKW